jgi:mannose-6-phosphate isomerase-like protein (cupin superfamily)
VTTYRPSPRPTFDGPALITRAAVTRHVWGDAEAGEVADWIYASTGRIHCLIFGLPPGGAFRHSEEFRTVFGADELMYVLEGTMVIANPETGEVHRIEQGRTVAFSRDTWHHAFAHGGGPLRVIEFFAPPPSTGSSGAYARTRPYVSDSRYARAPGDERRTLRPVADGDVEWRRDHGVLVGLHLATADLTAGLVEVNPGEASTVHEHGGDEVLFSLDGGLHVRAWHDDAVHVFELGPEDAAFIPAGARHEYRNYGGRLARALIGVAPSWS